MLTDIDRVFIDDFRRTGQIPDFGYAEAARRVAQQRRLESRERITVEDLGGIREAIVRLCAPSGIGDLSWIATKLNSLRRHTGKEIILHAAGDPPQRSEPFVRLLPEVWWGGYINRSSAFVCLQCLPSDWPEIDGPAMPFAVPEILNISANKHLEQGFVLADWMPQLDTDYHYPLAFTQQHEEQAAQATAQLPPEYITVYVSNRDKDRIRHGGWSLWDVDTWAGFIAEIGRLRPECGFLFIGADFDRDKTEAVASHEKLRQLPVKTMIGRPLGAALCALRDSAYCFSYPSGIGILANVLRTPCMMQLPWALSRLAQTYADPKDLASQNYRAWPNPNPREVLEWFITTPYYLEHS